MSTINNILSDIKSDLNSYQYLKLKTILEKYLDVKPIVLTNEELLNNFLSYKRFVGIKESSLAQYERSTKSFLLFSNKHCLEITKQDCLNYISHYKKTRNISQIGIVNQIGYISPFYDYLEKEDYILKNPWHQIDKIKVSKKQKEIFSNTELSKIRDNCKDKRDRAIIELLYCTGIRASELCSIKLCDCDFNSNEILVHGKGDKQRYVYITDTAKYYIGSYLKDRNYSDNDWLFINKRNDRKLNNKSLEDMLKRICSPLHIKAYPHKFRRTFCTTLADKGMQVAQISNLMGHSKLETTMVYYSSNKTNIHTMYDFYTR